MARKSQIAIEYSYRVRMEFPQKWIFWVHASNAARFEQGYRTIADRIQLPRRNEPTADILQLVSNWLCDETNGQWIMILDNADDFTVFLHPPKGRLESDTDDQGGEALNLITFLPQTPNGSILVTSRSEDAAGRLTGSHHDIIKVQPMDEGCALLLLRKKLRCKFDEDKAVELVRALDFMPLAISQAAAYIIQRAPRTTVARYLEDFRKSESNRENILNTVTGDLRRDSNASNCIITTWQISFKYICLIRPSASRLLSLMSFFDHQGIPKFLIHRYDDKDGSSDIDLKAKVDIELKDHSGMEFEEDVFTLKSYSLITTKVNSDQFGMHRLVQLSTRRWLEQNGELDKWRNKYLRIVSEVFPDTDYKYWKIFQLLYPHTERALEYRPEDINYLRYLCIILDKAAWYLAMQGNHSTAEKMIRKVLDGFEKIFGENHPATLASVSNLALVLQCQGKYRAAEKMNRRALDGMERVLGEEHPDTLLSVGNLARVLWHQGQYKEAEKMNRRALDGREKVLGEEHPETLSSVSNLALVSQHQGKYEAAEKMTRRALNEREKVWGEKHPHTLTSVNNLALVLQHQGKYEAAEKMNRRALDGREKLLGEEHPDTLKSVQCLAHLLHKQKQYNDAARLYERSCTGYQKTLGINHPTTLACLNHYSSMVKEMGTDRDSNLEVAECVQ